MTIKKYDKLVRDKIPTIIGHKGKKCKVYVATGKDYYQKLINKLQEEIQEFIDKPSVEELADIQEVVLTLAEYNKWNLEETRISKNLNRGGFERRYILQEVRD